MIASAELNVLGGELPAPVSERAPVLTNRALSDRYRVLRLRSETIARRARAGQFAMVAPDARPGTVLPRPMAIYARDVERGVVEIVYGVVGDGTRSLAAIAEGEHVVVTGPLGHGFTITDEARHVLLIGRGVGTCAMTSVAQDLAGTSVRVSAVLSGRDRTAVLGEDVLRRCGAELLLVTDADGTSRVSAVRERLHRAFDDDPPQLVLTSGSERLTRLAAQLAARWRAGAQVSIEAHMACGLGYCHGCAAGDGDGTREAPLVCRDGPVFGIGADPDPRP
ncbi:dihydroorotate oxidase electron transfer subunit [Saccharopolyspora sp. TS4A08]|uniref:Dihydroorotate oxidase electron transfer subunit n=1 Tax=Saccharopolyspora ipomoeae TaxID=3042027 RepID=A0ABT6PXW4_9PSEU|nr:dihydroorotate oxidase electron transfer subunit [Saccharopolyspora sp. TS4A08]MDI2032483.1 dihydroorotate oxidase electron transfer subunit [Saccharopolyspora sp. TS4A08]